jgi:TATA-box binding protein (TBP) (component of TFIID and TFIIIB)
MYRSFDFRDGFIGIISRISLINNDKILSLLFMSSKINPGKDEGRPRITNIVATGQFPKPLDIVKIHKEIDFPINEYEPETYPALLVKVEVNGNLRHVTLYRNGKYIITGASSEKDVNDIYEVIYDILSDAGYF